MNVEFKEKTYETAFVGELRMLTKVIYAPDQYDEGMLGFDASAFIPWPELMPFLPYRRFRRWRHLIGISSAEIKNMGDDLDNSLPPFRLNLFIQFKRPQYLTHSNAKEWSHWNREYFRYKVDANQQKLLQKLQGIASGRAAVVYAAPAIVKTNDLFAHQLNDAVIKNSNIVDAGLLTGHSKCTYADPGNVGMGHSEPEELNSAKLEEILGNQETEELSFTQHVKGTANVIKALFEDEIDGRETLDLARRVVLGGDLADIYPRAGGTWFDAAVTMAAFSMAFRIRVCAIG